jgi:hypothetical protein
MFVSQHYAAKAWPSHERRSAQARAIQQQGDFLLPARIDDTDVPGLSPTIAYVDCRRKSADELAALILEKVRRVAGATEDRPARGTPNLQVHATGGPSPDLRLVVANHGRADTFQATAKIVATRYDVNRPREGAYGLSWQGGTGSSMYLDRLETGFLVLARFKLLEPIGTLDRMWEAQLIEWDGSQEAVWSGFRWTITPDQSLPEYDIDVSIVGRASLRPFAGRYTLVPRSFAGPLELAERRREDADISQGA